MHLRLIAKLALSTSLAAILIFGGVLWFISPAAGSADNYIQMIHSYSLSQKSLVPAMWLSGLLLLSVTGLLTWLICLYSSFRIAGPLLRFARNLEIRPGEGQLLDIRQGDCLQELSRELKQSIATVYVHYDTTRTLVDETAVLLDRPQDETSLATAIERLQEHVAKGKIDA